MKKEYDFSKGKRGAIVSIPSGKKKITIRLDSKVIDAFHNQVEKAGGGNYGDLMNEVLKEHLARKIPNRYRLLKERCKKFEDCECPICPMEESDLSNCTYYPSWQEQVCPSIDFKNLQWIKTQKKLRKMRCEGYFTVEMMDRRTGIFGGTKGLDADKPEKLQLKRWLENHPHREKRIVNGAGLKALKEYASKKSDGLK